jgi:hypothetical protein
VNIDLVIAQLRTHPATSAYAGNIAGAAQYERAVQDQTWMALPSIYVIPLETEAGEVKSQTGYWQTNTERIGVIVVLDNSVPTSSGDRRGQTVIATVDQVQKSINAAILNWRPDSSSDNPGAPGNPSGADSVYQDQESRGLFFGGASLRGWDLARLFWEIDYGLDVTLSAADCWQPATQPLAITANVTSNQATLTASAKV